jgi:hypothetical protein
METRIYIKELPCYQRKSNTSEKSIRVIERHFYNLEFLTAERQKKEMEAFIRSRGNKLSLTTVDADIIHYNVVVRFMKDKYPLLDSFRAVPEEVLIKKFKAWLIDHGYQITRKHFMKSMGRNLQEEAGPVKYLRLLLQFLEPEDKRPEWEKMYGIWKIWDLRSDRTRYR